MDALVMLTVVDLVTTVCEPVDVDVFVDLLLAFF
jgi:hypothetical protein